MSCDLPNIPEKTKLQVIHTLQVITGHSAVMFALHFLGTNCSIVYFASATRNSAKEMVPELSRSKNSAKSSNHDRAKSERNLESLMIVSDCEKHAKKLVD